MEVGSTVLRVEKNESTGSSAMEPTIYKSSGVSMVSSKPVTNLDEFFSAAVNSTLHINSKGSKNILGRMMKEQRAKDQPLNRLEEMEKREITFHKNMLRQKEKEKVSLPMLHDDQEIQNALKTNYDFWHVERDILEGIEH